MNTMHIRVTGIHVTLNISHLFVLGTFKTLKYTINGHNHSCPTALENRRSHCSCPTFPLCPLAILSLSFLSSSSFPILGKPLFYFLWDQLFLSATNEWEHTVFFFLLLCLIYFTKHNVLQLCPCCWKSSVLN
jgi:hypothetical protein